MMNSGIDQTAPHIVACRREVRDDDNVIISNGRVGLSVASNATYRDNTMTDSVAVAVTIGGVNLGGNYCAGTRGDCGLLPVSDLEATYSGTCDCARLYAYTEMESV
jgi:hypothetical protein